MEDIQNLITSLQVTKESIESLAQAYQNAKDELEQYGEQAAELGRVTYYSNYLALEKIVAALEALTPPQQ